MSSAENEEEYLRQIADFIVENLVDDSRVGGRAIEAEYMSNATNVNFF